MEESGANICTKSENIMLGKMFFPKRLKLVGVAMMTKGDGGRWREREIEKEREER